MPNLPSEVTQCHIVPAFKDYSLFSVAQLTQHGYKVIFGDRVIIMKNGVEIYDGHFDKKSGLFWIKIAHSPKHNPSIPKTIVDHFTANTFTQQLDRSSKKELATFYHRCLLCPVKTTLIKAIKNNHFSTWPGLTLSLIHISEPTRPY